MIPHTDWERLELLKELEHGDKIVIPVNEEHAKFMIRIAQLYLDQCRQDTFDALRKDYS